MSAQQLADECKKLGMPIQRSVIANFENGRRANVSVAELLVFAAALKVSPMELVFPVGYEHSCEGLPGRVDETYDWAQWFSGEAYPKPGWEFVAEEENAMEICRGLIPMLEILVTSKEQLSQAEADLDAVRDAAEVAQQQVEAAEREMERVLAAREANIQAREESENRTSDEYRLLMEEAARLRQLQKNAAERLARAREGALSYGQKKHSVEYWRQHVVDDEKSAREVLAEFDKHGFVPPDLPEELAYLKQPEPAKAAPQRRRATRIKK